MSKGSLVVYANTITRTDAESHHVTLPHETPHSTRHGYRLEGALSRMALGDEGHAREDHAAYTGSWLEVWKNDKRAIFQPASYTQKAVDFLHRLPPPKAGAAA